MVRARLKLKQKWHILKLILNANDFEIAGLVQKFRTCKVADCKQVDFD